MNFQIVGALIGFADPVQHRQQRCADCAALRLHAHRKKPRAAGTRLGKYRTWLRERTMRSPILVCMVSLLFAVASANTRAQEEVNADPQFVQLELKPDERMPPGKAAFMEGEADKSGHRFLVEGTELSQPVSVSVLTEYPEDHVRVRVVKDDWDTPERDEETGAHKRVDLTFRTFEGFKLWITAEKPTNYQLVVWIGDPVEAPLPSIATPASKFVEGQKVTAPNPDDAETAEYVGTQPGKISLSTLEVVLIGTLLLLGGAFATFVLMRRKRTDGSLK